MKVKIFQINLARDINRVKFWDLDHLKQLQGSEEVDSSIYDEVFEGDLDVSDLEMIYQQFNQEGHPFFRGHSLSVSDVVLFHDKTYFCRSFGFAPVEFDINATHKPDTLIKVLYIGPHKAPYVAELENTLRGMQRAVYGPIETVSNTDGTVFVLNRDGKLNGMEDNRHIDGDVIVGPFFVAGNTGQEFCSLTDEQIDRYTTQFA